MCCVAYAASVGYNYPVSGPSHATHTHTHTLSIGKTWNASIFEIEKPAGEGRE